MMASADKAAWLAGLKAGDTVAFNAGGYGTSGYTILTVDRTTPTQVICGHRRFSRDTGYVRGSTSYQQLQPLTDDLKERIEYSDLRNWLSNLQCTRTPPTHATLRAMKAAYDASTQPPVKSDDHLVATVEQTRKGNRT